MVSLLQDQARIKFPSLDPLESNPCGDRMQACEESGSPARQVRITAWPPFQKAQGWREGGPCSPHPKFFIGAGEGEGAGRGCPSSGNQGCWWSQMGPCKVPPSCPPTKTGQLCSFLQGGGGLLCPPVLQPHGRRGTRRQGEPAEVGTAGLCLGQRAEASPPRCSKENWPSEERLRWAPAEPGRVSEGPLPACMSQI